MAGKVLVAGVGNVLRRDDGFGVAVAQRLCAEGCLPPGVDVLETGIGGLSIVQQLMDGYAALIVVDVVDRGARPGTVLVLEPELRGGEGGEAFTDLHLAEPSRVLALARALGVLPERVFVVGCQPCDCYGLGEALSPPVQAAVAVAAERVRALSARLAAAPGAARAQRRPGGGR